MINPFKYWWLILIKGLILLILAFVAFFQPVTALMGLAFYLGFSLLLTGLSVITAALINRKSDDSFGWHLSIGIIDVLFAFVLLSNPAITAAIFPFIVGFWIIVYGIMLFANSFQVKKTEEKSWWTETLGGILTIIIGYLIMSNLIIGALTITFWIGLAFLLFGVVSISVAFRLRKIKSIN